MHIIPWCHIDRESGVQRHISAPLPLWTMLLLVLLSNQFVILFVIFAPMHYQIKCVDNTITYVICNKLLTSIQVNLLIFLLKFDAVFVNEHYFNEIINIQ